MGADVSSRRKPDGQAVDGGEAVRIDRFGLIEHRVPQGKVVCTENGISYRIDVAEATSAGRCVFDTGPTRMQVLQNIGAFDFGTDAESVVTSCTHVDGPLCVLENRRRTTPTALDPDTFLKRVLRDKQGDEVVRTDGSFNRRPTKAVLATIVEVREPVQLAEGSIFATSEIPQEPPRPGDSGPPRQRTALPDPQRGVCEHREDDGFSLEGHIQNVVGTTVSSGV
jgi:metal-dependent hydrolase (beta-lactamase superfamily II)